MSSPFEFAFQARDVILGMTILEGLAHGIYAAIFWFTIYLLFQKKGRQGASRVSTLFIIVPLYVLGIIHLAIRWKVARQAFVVEGKTQDDILASFLGQPLWCVALSSISFGLTSLIADYVMVWRVWVIWGRNWKAPLLPLLLIVTATVFWALSIAFQIDPKSGLFSNSRNKFEQPAMIYFILSLISTVISTLLIIFRIIHVSRQTGSPLVGPYRKAIEIIVESAALYSVALIVYLPFFTRDDFLDGWPQALLLPITAIAPTIIATRVSLGLASEYTTFQTQSTFVASTTVASASSQTVGEGSINGGASSTHSHSEKQLDPEA